MPSSISSKDETAKESFVNKQSFFWLLLTVLVFSALVKLGLWQSSRAVEKEQRLLKIEKLNTQSALSLEQVLSLSNNANSSSTINDFPIAIQGFFDGEKLFFLDNQVNKNRLGYRAYQVAEVNEHAVLINLGWVQGSINRQELPKVDALHGEYAFKGNVRLIEVGVVLQEQLFTQVEWPVRVQQIELDKFSSLIGRQLLPFVVYLDKNEQIGFEKNWQPIVMPPEKHRGYAFQWYSLALAWLILMLWAKFGTKAYNNKNNKSKAT